MNKNNADPAPPNHALAEQVQHFWERSWSRGDYNPTWVVTGIPAELQVAVEQQWFAPGSSVLDIGCGTGELSAWLAGHGFTVHGIDCAQAAIERAKTKHGDGADRLTFQVADVCRDVAPTPRYEGLLDRACLHGLPKALHAAYVTTVASWAVPGAHVLLLYGLHRDEVRTPQEIQAERQELALYLSGLFDKHFAIRRIEPAVIERSAPHEPVPGLALWMTRLSS